MPSAEIRTRLDTIHDQVLNGERIDRNDALLLHLHEELGAMVIEFKKFMAGPES